MSKNLFIDTNMYLSFYRYSNDDLDELRKLSVAVTNKDIKLYTTSQLRDEFRRNRETVIAASIKGLQDQVLPKAFPQVVKNYPGYQKLREKLKAYSEELNSLTDQIRNDAIAGVLHADGIIRDLFQLAHEIKINDDMYLAARRRFDLGNPPGKEKSYGDAVNWVGLLETVPEGEDIYIISGDKDYSSVIEQGSISEFLKDEWGNNKASVVKLYLNFTSFFKEHYPQIKLAVELEREILVNRLVNSENFATTHYAISKLAQFTEFSEDQVRSMFIAALTNSQISWIATDPDVGNFYSPLVLKYPDVLGANDIEQLKMKLSPGEQSVEIADEDLPF